MKIIILVSNIFPWKLYYDTSVPYWLLTLNMLDYFKDYKRYIYILNSILDLAWLE